MQHQQKRSDVSGNIRGDSDLILNGLGPLQKLEQSQLLRILDEQAWSLKKRHQLFNCQQHKLAAIVMAPKFISMMQFMI